MSDSRGQQDASRKIITRRDDTVLFDNEELRLRILRDTASALLAGLAVSPIVAAIDLSVANKAFRPEQPFFTVLRSTIRRFPLWILTKPSIYMFALYAGTYITANVCDTLQSLKTGEPAASTTNSLTKFGAVSGTNICLSLAKDNQIAKACGGGLGPKRMPLVCYPPLLLRDAVSLYATFNLPASLAGSLPVCWETVGSRLMIAQVILPVVSQTLATPLHLLGLNLYYESQRQSIWQRVQAIRAAYTSATAARMARVVPGLAIGNVVNTSVRTALMNK